MSVQRWAMSTVHGHTDDEGEWVTYADHVAALRAAYEKGRHHGWALNAECCGSCPGECEQRVVLNEIKRGDAHG